MTLNEYQEYAGKYINPELNESETLAHALHGLAAEVGELHGIFQKQLQGHEDDPVHIAIELGDVLWMLSEICTALSLPLDKVAEINLEKLRRRYPDGFSVERSVHREDGDI